jgi:serine/threonine-protein kinase
VDGTPFGPYRLIELLGRGGMGEVWRAFDTDTDRIVAIKLLPAHFSENEEFQQRFRREAHAAARLNTPHVIPIHRYGEIDGRLYVDMRLIEGRDLQAVLGVGPLQPARAVRIIEQVAEALQAAHEIGLVHRDVKPSNILLDRNDFAYLIDFGIARAADETRLTKSGNAIGTFAYMAPERLGTRAQEDARADIYSLACVLYECLTGHPPFDADTTAGLVVAHLNTPPPQPSTAQPRVPAQMDAVIATGMAKDPDRRYGTTVELANAAHSAITVPMARTPSGAAPHPLAPMPGEAPTLFDTRPSPPGTPGAATFPAAVSPGAPIRNQTPAIPPAPPGRRRWWARKPVLVAAALVVVAALTATIFVATTWHTRRSAPAGPTTSAQSSTATRHTQQSAPAGPLSSAPPATAPQVNGPQQVLPFTGLNNPNWVAVDGAGTVYVTDFDWRVLRLAVGATSQEVLPFTGLYEPAGVAVAGAGTVYVADTHNDRVLRLAAGAASQEVLPFTGLTGPAGLAVDGAGTLYVADRGNNRVLRLAAGATSQEVLPFTGLKEPAGLAVDGAGNLYLADYHNGRVLWLAAGATTPQVLPFTDLSGSHGVAVNGAGNLYVTDMYHNRVLKLPVK